MKAPRDWPLRSKVLALILVVSALPLALTALVEFRESRRQIEGFTQSLLEANADGLARDLDALHAQMQRAAERLARSSALGRTFGPSPAAQDIADVKTLLAEFIRTDARLRGLTVMDTSGTVLLASEPQVVGRNFAWRPFFRDAIHGVQTVPDVHVTNSEVTPEALIAYSAPVRQGQKIVGVATIFAQAEALWQLVRQANGRGGAGSHAIVVGPGGVMLAHGLDQSKVFHPAGRLPAAEVEAMVSENRFGRDTRLLLDQPVSIPELFQRGRGEPLPTVFRASVLGTPSVAVARCTIHAPWTVFYLAPESTQRAPVERLISLTAYANLAVMVVALLAALWLTRRILRPIGELSTAASAMEKGDLRARVPEGAGDELGKLGRTFNAMAGSLAASQEQLEQKVQRRTEALGAAKAALEAQNASLAQRTAELTERQSRDLAFARTLSALSGPGSLREAMNTALAQAEEYLGPLLLVCYRGDRELLVPVAGRGGEAKPLRIAGRLQEAIASQKPMLLRDLPDDAELRFEAGLASGKPHCLFLVPLTMGTRDVGLLAAGFASDPTEQQQAFLVELALPLALAMGRHELHEQTERFALQLAQRNEALRDQSEQLNLKQTELEQKNKEIARANDLKSEFLANMSHELRTPLNAVIGFSELLLEEQHKLLPGHVQFVRDILASGRHLLLLINSVLDLAKIEAGRVTLEVQPLDPQAQIISACTLVSALAQRKSIAITQAARTHRTVLADRSKLQQILLNLLSNAIKFSEADKQVEVGVEDQGAQLRFWVKDQGPGIPEHVRPELFKPFVQGEATLSKKHEGTGLGLAITRRLVEYQGGDVGVDTELGKGSTFWFTLPADDRAPAVIAPPPAPEPSQPAAPESPARQQKKPLVLVVEDDPANARLLRFHLESAGYAVAEAKREAEAIELAHRLRPQVVLLDLILPDGEDGLAVLRELKNSQQTVHIPVIVVSVVQETRRARELGASECFLKPVDGVKLLEAVQRVCPTAAPVRARATVLVVDDHDLNRELARTLLERRGCRVLLARNGQEGARVAKVERPDLVLMDLAMPVKDGITAARELKADPDTAQIPLIAFTALAMRGDEERARKAGFDGYLTKPLETQALDAALEKFLTPQARA